MVLDVLKKIGLSSGEEKIYEILLDNGRQPVAKIHELAGIERRNIYDILNKLIEKGLVSYITENKTRIFQTTHPKKIISYVDEQKDELDRTRKEVEAQQKELIKRFEAIKPEVDAQLFRGIEGIKATWDDMLNASEILWLGSGGYVPRMMPHYFERWNKLRAKGGIFIKHLYRLEYKGKLNHEQYTAGVGEIRYLPKEFSGNPTAICIWGSKVGMFTFGDKFFAFVIESKELAENYKDYHKYIWKNVAIVI